MYIIPKNQITFPDFTVYTLALINKCLAHTLFWGFGFKSSNCSSNSSPWFGQH